MCGLVLAAGLEGAPISVEAIQQMASVIAHRGPDDNDVFVDHDVAAGFRRLSILDLTPSGSQPMHSDDGRYIIVFNGEIYNYIELRGELERLGHRFRSTGDTEVLLKSYIEWGAACLNRFNGMWAFVIFDTQTRELFVSRDRFGIKPLYWYRGNGILIIASEIKSIRQSERFSARVNWQVAGRYLVTGELDDSLDCFYEGVQQFPPGSYGLIGADRTVRPSKYWHLTEDPPEVSADVAEQFADLFDQSVALRLRSDVPVGVLLSGGLDSTSIICSLTRTKSKLPVAQRETTAAFSYNDPEFDESRIVEATIRQTGASLYNLATDPVELWNELDRLLHYHDEPVHSSSALIGFKLMELAAAHDVKVVLNGQGADETLAGYPNYFDNYWYTLLTEGRFGKAWSEASAYSEQFGSSPAKLLSKHIGYFVRSGLSQLPQYRRLGQWRRRRNLNQATWYSQDLLDAIPVGDRGPWRLRLDDALLDSVNAHPLPLYLRVEDRNSMAHSVEARLPFLDYRLVQLAFSLAASWKMRGPWNKYVLRQAMRGRIPEEARTRTEKFGFPTPLHRWLRESMRPVFEELLASPEMRDSPIFNLPMIRRDFERHVRGDAELGAELFNLAQFQKWLKISGARLG